MRAVHHYTSIHDLNIRVNTIAPYFTDSNMTPLEVLREAGVNVQTPEVVALSVALLAVDEKRHCQTIYSEAGLYREIEESVMAHTTELLTLSDEANDYAKFNEKNWKAFIT